MDFWIPLLGSALGGAVVTSVFGLIKNGQDKSIEHARWLRDSKQSAYAEFLSAIVEASTTLPPAAEAGEVQRRSAIALSQIRLIGAPGVTSAAVSFGTHVNNMHRLSQRRREMVELDYSANEDAIMAIGPKMTRAISEIPALTEAFVRSARLDVGTKVR
ncbi:hypothetical protein [Arthrobacter sp. CJ23]|uniref:hypothetical protein n=1 Tax=Arthrobacter sp. CJ23 TaxID=2972479 RepID=UPI00215D3434|nr:hypothetical protein [Arthrobacter sp. CJ23]UVJ37992.1 hypothetical protein NVV90_12015 [Arthrobacter sp. CJ23]